jgi:hypothetical protein
MQHTKDTQKLEAQYNGITQNTQKACKCRKHHSQATKPCSPNMHKIPVRQYSTLMLSLAPNRMS